MSKIENALQLALEIANDPRCGYDQVNRWGPNYDCSSFVITCLEKAGIKVKSAGATYTGNMYTVFIKTGFFVVPLSQRRRGDVLLNRKYHTCFYLGDERIVHASINEKGTATGGKTGDNNGREIYERSYYVYPKGGWDYCLRYPEENEEVKTVNIEMPTLEKGAKGEAVKTLQILLNNKFGMRLDVDGSFGQLTYNAVKSYQRNKGLEPVDGFVGAGTWGALLK